MSHLENLSNKISRNVPQVDKLLASFESLVLSALIRVGAFLTAIPNGLLVARSTQQGLGVSWGLALIVAASLEIVGMSLVHHWQAVRHWNETKNKTDVRMRQGLALVLVILYFLLDFGIVTALCWQTWKSTGNASIWTSLAFPLASVFVTICTSEREHLFRLLNEKDIAKAERKTAQKPRQQTRKKTVTQTAQTATQAAQNDVQAAQSSGIDFGAGNSAGEKTREQAFAVLQARPAMSGAELGRAIGKSERLGRKLKNELMPLMAIDNGNGQGKK